MAQVDPNLGITGMQSADRLFTGLQTKTETLIHAEEASAKAHFDASVSSFKIAITLFISLLIIAFVAGSLLSIYMSNMIITPLKAAIASAQRIANGNLTDKIHATQSDETGDLLKALSDMQENLREIIAPSTRLARAHADVLQRNRFIRAHCSGHQ